MIVYQIWDASVVLKCSTLYTSYEIVVLKTCYFVSFNYQDIDVKLCTLLISETLWLNILNFVVNPCGLKTIMGDI